MNRQFFKIAVTRLSLFRAARRPRAILTALSEATGISPLRLLAAERRMRTLGSLAPLKELLDDSSLTTHQKLRWRVGLEQKRRGEHTPQERVASVLRLAIQTAYGQVEIVARVDVEKAILPLKRHQQSARILMLYRVSRGGEDTFYHQSLTLSGESVDGVPVKETPQLEFGGIIHTESAAL